MLVGIIAVFTGLILDSVAKGRREIKLLAYLSEPPFPGDTACCDLSGGCPFGLNRER
jgi:hypothetical protein